MHASDRNEKREKINITQLCKTKLLLQTPLALCLMPFRLMLLNETGIHYSSNIIKLSSIVTLNECKILYCLHLSLDRRTVLSPNIMEPHASNRINFTSLSIGKSPHPESKFHTQLYRFEKPKTICK